MKRQSSFLRLLIQAKSEVKRRAFLFVREGVNLKQKGLVDSRFTDYDVCYFKCVKAKKWNDNKVLLSDF